MAEDTPKDDAETKKALEGVDPDKRRTLTKLAAGAFVTPVVASFPMDGLTISRAQAQSPSGSGFVKEADKDEDGDTDSGDTGDDKEKRRRKKRHMNSNMTLPSNQTL
jgi:hypothetical protein